jgi:hypothetical protein
MTFLWWLKYAIDLALQKRRLIQSSAREVGAAIAAEIFRELRSNVARRNVSEWT